MRLTTAGIAGVGIGLRWEFLEEAIACSPGEVPFWEISPENYLNRGGYYAEGLDRVRDCTPLVTHGLTLSIGGVEAPDARYLRELRALLARLGVAWHSDHLSTSRAGARMLHELLPIKHSRAMVQRIAERARQVRDRLGVPFAVENVTFYAHAGRPDMDEAEFLSEVLERGEASLLLDVNNVFVNAVNHGTDPIAFLQRIPLHRVVEIHVAGHERLASGLLLDTHGAPVIAPVLDLLAWVVERTGPIPVLLERDNAIPSLAELLEERQRIEAVVSRALERRAGAPSAEPALHAHHAPQHQHLELSARGWATAEAAGAPASASADPREATHTLATLEGALGELVAADGLHIDSEPSLRSLYERHGVPSDEVDYLLRQDPERWQVYRDLVWETVRGAIALAMPRTAARLGPLFDELVRTFLAHQGAQSPVLREIVDEFLAFWRHRARDDARIPGYLWDLATHESASVRVASGPCAAHVEAHPLALDRPVRFATAVELDRYSYRVHELTDSLDDRTEPAAQPLALLVYRGPEHAVRYLELSPLAADVIERLIGGAPLAIAITQSAAHLGCALDARTLDDLARWLADMAERGVLGGSAPPQPDGESARDAGLPKRPGIAGGSTPEAARSGS